MAFCVLLVTLHPEVSDEVPEEVVASEGLSVPDPDPDREAVYSSLALLCAGVSTSFGFSLNSEPVGFMASGLLSLSGPLLFPVVGGRFSLFAPSLSALALSASSNKLVNMLLITWKG